jgi:serine protease inhibitor
MTRRQWISGLPIGLAMFDPGKDAVSSPSVETAKIAVAAQRNFGLRLLRELVERKPRENVFISPLSIFLALHMTENGAAGSTQTAMRNTLALPDLDAATLNSSTAALQAELQSRGPGVLTIANALWASRRFTIDPDYVKLCTTLFHARTESLDFEKPEAAAEINDWVKSATNGKITNLVTADVVVKAVVILTNAVYFAATWRNEFPSSQTQKAPFHLTGGGTKDVPMMHQARIAGAYRAGSGFEGAMLSYKEPGFFLYALLPQEGKTPQEVLVSLDPEHLADAPSGVDLDLKLPRFNLDFSTSLADYLAKMGMGAAFHPPQADFSPMGSKEFFISDVIHKTRLEVDEKGTVAAAATGVVMRASAVMRPRPVKTLVFDRPFVVLIGDAQTGALLFAGVIEAP